MGQSIPFSTKWCDHVAVVSPTDGTHLVVHYQCICVLYIFMFLLVVLYSSSVCVCVCAHARTHALYIFMCAVHIFVLHIVFCLCAVHIFVLFIMFCMCVVCIFESAYCVLYVCCPYLCFCLHVL